MRIETVYNLKDLSKKTGISTQVLSILNCRYDIAPLFKENGYLPKINYARYIKKIFTLLAKRRTGRRLKIKDSLGREIYERETLRNR